MFKSVYLSLNSLLDNRCVVWTGTARNVYVYTHVEREIE